MPDFNPIGLDCLTVDRLLFSYGEHLESLQSSNDHFYRVKIGKYLNSINHLLGFELVDFNLNIYSNERPNISR